MGGSNKGALGDTWAGGGSKGSSLVRRRWRWWHWEQEARHRYSSGGKTWASEVQGTREQRSFRRSRLVYGPCRERTKTKAQRCGSGACSACSGGWGGCPHQHRADPEEGSSLPETRLLDSVLEAEDCLTWILGTNGSCSYPSQGTL